ncbi:MAG: hypothetical protein K9M02_01520 [Thiohalocapsa sp.]|nr:hypothetical protein [Thiohalocapsa sp.]
MARANQVAKDIERFQAEAEVWYRLIVANTELFDSKGAEFLPKELGVDGESSGFSVGYALDRLLQCAFRLRDLEHMGRCFWPHLKAFGQPLGEPSTQRLSWGELLRLYRAFAPTDASFRLLSVEYQEHTLGDSEIREPFGRLKVFDSFAAFRRFTGKASVVGEELNGLYYLLQDQWRGLLEGNVEQLSHDDRQRIRGSIGRYLSRHGLFPWLVTEHYGSRPVSAYMELAFEVAGLADTENRMHVKRVFDEILKDSEADDELKNEVASVAGRLYEVVREVGSLDDVYDSIVDEGGQWGRDSMVGSSARINIIPSWSDATGECREILVAIARGPRRRRVGLKDVLREVRAHLVRCGDSRCRPNGPTRAVVLITDTWDPGIISESIGDFRAHVSSAVPKVFVGLLVNGSQVTLQAVT